ncbi:MAG: GGDEF domain-containing protein [Bacillota bacterium]|nr:GGDEF domain-containing protein [Bacillota bacterium]
MMAFIIMDYDNKKEFNFAIAISLLVSFLYFLSEIVPYNNYYYQTSDAMNHFLSGITILTVSIPITYIFSKYSIFLYYRNEELNKLANTDPLTQILNRRVLFEHGLEEYLLAKKYNHEFTLIILDIDHFKNINDLYGHPAGDLLLIKLTNLILNNTRKEDTFARYGGEEFALLLRKTNSSEGNLIADKLLSLISNKDFIINEDILNITVSIGVAQYNDSYSSFEDIIIAADKALYHSKENGRNQVTVI